VAEPLFDIARLCFGYKDQPVLRDLDLILSSGRFYGLLGPNGCGKSTLIDLLVGHLRPRTGTIAFGGRSLTAYNRRALARQMALVPQNFYINFPFTVKEVVMMGRYPHMERFARPSAADEQMVDNAMALTGIAGFAERSIARLSGGERQRVVAARALAQDTPVLILDEPTSNMDINHSLSLLGLVKTSVINQGKTAVCVLQDLNLAALFSDELVLMKAGRIRAFGPVAEVLTSANVRAVFDVDAKIDHHDYAGALQVVFKKGGG
jgi:iron complex transport system ATP-binding protein